jgi:regulatory protein
LPFAKAKKREPVGEAGLFDYAVGALARRMRTVRELRTLMRERALPGDEGQRDMDRVVARLVELRYLSDEKFAEDFTRIRKDSRGFGRRRVAQDLTQKGVPKELVQAAVGAAFDESDEVALARAYCERKRIEPPDGPDAQKQAARINRPMMRAGYSSSAIGKLLRAWRVPVTDTGLDSDSSAEPEDELADDDLPRF